MNKNKVFIIAEAGVNHNGSLSNAKKLVDIAKLAGANAVKFQTWKTENLVSKESKVAKYQKINTGENNQYKMLKKLELSFDYFNELIRYCSKKKIQFLSTADDFESASFLRKKQKIFKIGSGEIDNIPFIEFIMSFKKPIILSTGCSDMKTIEKTLLFIKTKKFDFKKLTLMHCTSAYPVPYNDVNLKVINTLKKFGTKIGFSDHTVDHISAIGAIALGATVIEKHFTISNKLKGPDHKMSLNPKQLTDFIKKIRNFEIAMGSETKRITNSEKSNLSVIRKSIFSNKLIKKNQMITMDMLNFKRPGEGISPMQINKVLNRRTKIDIKEDSLIKFKDLI